MDIRMAAKDDTSDAKSEEEQKYAYMAVRAAYKGAEHDGSWEASKGQSLELESQTKPIRQRWQGSTSSRKGTFGQKMKERRRERVKRKEGQ